MAKKIAKKAWKDFEITKVRLNPEQAVLGCCDNEARANLYDEGLRQCTISCSHDGEPHGTSSSS
ncbi:MAG: hypothetical protein NT099_09365 [Candidatus Saganbacteria bacterium]|nr:hypothetical protein [Candidatus Saganbacteria bacterium]